MTEPSSQFIVVESLVFHCSGLTLGTCYPVLNGKNFAFLLPDGAVQMRLFQQSKPCLQPYPLSYSMRSLRIASLVISSRRVMETRLCKWSNPVLELKAVCVRSFPSRTRPHFDSRRSSVRVLPTPIDMMLLSTVRPVS